MNLFISEIFFNITKFVKIIEIQLLIFFTIKSTLNSYKRNLNTFCLKRFGFNLVIVLFLEQ